MTSRSGSGNWQRVREARRQARLALGQDPDHSDLFDGQPQGHAAAYVPHSQPAAEPRHDETFYVLTLGEAAARLGVTRIELEAMIAAGKIEALPTGYTRTIPISELERLSGREG